MGPPGAGKTHVAISLCLGAKQFGYKAVFYKRNGFIEALFLTEVNGKLSKFLSKLA